MWIEFFREVEEMDNIYTDFTDDLEKMADFYKLSKEEFLAKYNYLTEEEYHLTEDKVSGIQDLNKLIVKSIWGNIK